MMIVVVGATEEAVEGMMIAGAAVAAGTVMTGTGNVMRS